MRRTTLTLFAAGALATACTQTGRTERGALGGAAVGAAAGAAIGAATGGNAGRGAAIGAGVGAAGGAVAGAASDRRNDDEAYNLNNRAGLTYDSRADRYYYTDRSDGCTYWQNGDYRAC